MTSTSISTVSSDGLSSNIQSLKSGACDIAFCDSDIITYACNAERTLAEAGGYQGFSTVAALCKWNIHIVTVNPDIKTVADLKGKKVFINTPGSRVYYFAIDILGAYDLTEDDIIPIYQDDNIDSGCDAKALVDGQIDASFVCCHDSVRTLFELSVDDDDILTEIHLKQFFSFVSLDDEHIDKLIDTAPYYSKKFISKDTYDTAEDCLTVTVTGVIIANDSVSETDVYNFLVGTFEDIPHLQHFLSWDLDLEFAASFTSVGYHPGAVAYFADKGITVPRK